METAATISLAGVLAAAFLPTFTRHLRLSKVAEAVEQLESLHRGMAAYYVADHGTNKQSACLPETLAPFPTQPSAEPVIVDFDDQATPDRAAWQALGMQGEQSLRYSYQVVVAQPGCGARPQPAAPAVVFRATGDLDGDGVFSTIERSANFSADQRTLVPVGPLHIRDRTE